MSLPAKEAAEVVLILPLGVVIVDSDPTVVSGTGFVVLTGELTSFVVAAVEVESGDVMFDDVVFSVVTEL